MKTASTILLVLSMLCFWTDASAQIREALFHGIDVSSSIIEDERNIEKVTSYLLSPDGQMRMLGIQILGLDPSVLEGEQIYERVGDVILGDRSVTTLRPEELIMMRVWYLSFFADMLQLERLGASLPEVPSAREQRVLRDHQSKTWGLNYDISNGKYDGVSHIRRFHLAEVFWLAMEDGGSRNDPYRREGFELALDFQRHHSLGTGSAPALSSNKRIKSLNLYTKKVLQSLYGSNHQAYSSFLDSVKNAVQNKQLLGGKSDFSENASVIIGMMKCLLSMKK